MPSQSSALPLTLERLWQFCLQHYSAQHMKEACLTLQNHYQGNVNLILLLKWLDEESLTFTANDWPILEHAMQHSEIMLHQFRDIRRKSKPHLPDTLYREHLQFELHLEKLQQADLIRCINQILLIPRGEQTPLTHQYCQQLQAGHLSQYFFATKTAKSDT